MPLAGLCVRSNPLHRRRTARRDDPTRRMRRSILAFEKLLGVAAPSRLHACAHAEPHWEHRCAPGTMAEATEWLAAATERWLAS